MVKKEQNKASSKETKKTVYLSSSSLTQEDFVVLFKKYVMGRVKLNDDEETQARSLFTKVTTVQDVFNIVDYVVSPIEKMLLQFMENSEIQDIMLERMGATQEDWKAAKEQHEKEKADNSAKKQEKMKELFEKQLAKSGVDIAKVKSIGEKIVSEMANKKEDKN